MAAQEPYDYLPGTATADYVAANLAVTPQRTLTERGGFPGQRRHQSDGAGFMTTTRNTTPRFWFLLIWDAITTSDAGIIFDYYFDVAKGKGLARSFKFTHPTDGHVYICKFDDSEINRNITAILTTQGFTAIRLVVIDRVND
jgi:hypothetical protein